MKRKNIKDDEITPPLKKTKTLQMKIENPFDAYYDSMSSDDESNVELDNSKEFQRMKCFEGDPDNIDETISNEHVSNESQIEYLKNEVMKWKNKFTEMEMDFKVLKNVLSCSNNTKNKSYLFQLLFKEKSALDLLESTYPMIDIGKKTTTFEQLHKKHGSIKRETFFKHHTLVKLMMTKFGILDKIVKEYAGETLVVDVLEGVLKTYFRREESDRSFITRSNKITMQLNGNIQLNSSLVHWKNHFLTILEKEGIDSRKGKCLLVQYQQRLIHMLSNNSKGEDSIKHSLDRVVFSNILDRFLKKPVNDDNDERVSWIKFAEVNKFNKTKLTKFLKSYGEGTFTNVKEHQDKTLADIDEMKKSKDETFIPPIYSSLVI